MTVMERFIHIASSIDSTNMIGSDGDLKHIAMSTNIAAIDSTAVTAKSTSVVSISPCVIAPSPVI